MTGLSWQFWSVEVDAQWHYWQRTKFQGWCSVFNRAGQVPLQKERVPSSRVKKELVPSSSLWKGTWNERRSKFQVPLFRNFLDNESLYSQRKKMLSEYNIYQYQNVVNAQYPYDNNYITSWVKEYCLFCCTFWRIYKMTNVKWRQQNNSQQSPFLLFYNLGSMALWSQKWLQKTRQVSSNSVEWFDAWLFID